MKKLQNNFTTPEQSKRLLELGVPADSADCYYLNRLGSVWVRRVSDEHMFWFSNIDRTPIPCWSLGRLMEIYAISCPTDVLLEAYDELNCTDGHVCAMMQAFEIAHEDSILDFSELEE